MSPTLRHWLNDAGLALALTVLAWALRRAGYPRCPGDEAAWVQIVQSLDRGEPWPVSGPGYLAAVDAMGELFGQAAAEAIPAWGTGSVFVLALTLLRIYRQMQPLPPWLALAALALSSHFWAPLLESRPQQWGQVLVLLGSWLCWRWLNGRAGGGAFFAVLAVTALTHLLSHAVLLWVCAALVLVRGGQEQARRQRRLAGLALLLSVAVYLLPQGPYAAMLHDVWAHHLPRLTPQRLLGGAGLAMASTIPLAIVFHRQRRHTSYHDHHLWQTLATKPRPCALALVGLTGAALSGQALLLPPEAWQPYGGSPARFAGLQAGNLALALCFLVGLVVCLQAQRRPGALPADAPAGLRGQRSTRAGHLPPLAARFLAICLPALAALAGVLLLASLWLLHTNWLLRLLNYGLLFGAPLMAVGLSQAAQRWPRGFAWPLGALVGVSLLATLRPSPILAC
ncbi:hypothetical protein CCO03_02125 [Comamonas serinivorans]|uniref:Glycosyltransferase RgtA/B/C/D-like domain-containing protein n=1 Tax=Comamonas serinivorans TaxID=1082851 RepID=A0A1Y0EK31_9BURK|nr:hypothetical protein [Comamonas serinivorans]ARU03642.1 hypothetical protein CCO03_02125 [Comamonas serinivorans]